MKKRTETNIDQLKNQRRLNVQEQIAIKKIKILEKAKYWRTHGVLKPIVQIFIEKGIDIHTSIMLEYEQDFPGMSTNEGIVVTQDGNFLNCTHLLTFQKDLK